MISWTWTKNFNMWKIFELIDSTSNHFLRLYEVELSNKKHEEVANEFTSEDEAKKALSLTATGADYVILQVIKR